MNEHEYAHHMVRLIDAADIATSARPRVPRFTADEEGKLIQGLSSAVILVAYLLKGVANDTDDPPSNGT